jgi:hypothetical protein
MSKSILAASCLCALALGDPGNAAAQGRPDPQAVLAAQRKALARLAFMDGVWRGPAWTILPSGEKHPSLRPSGSAPSWTGPSGSSRDADTTRAAR